MEEGARAAEERAEKLPHECSQCHFMKPAGVYVCPKCGHKPLAGEDIDTDTGRKLKTGGEQRQPTKAEKQAGGVRSNSISASAYRSGKSLSAMRCSHTFRERFGVWPNGLSDYPMDITPTVSNFIKHKQISFAKQREKNSACKSRQKSSRTRQEFNRRLIASVISDSS